MPPGPSRFRTRFVTRYPRPLQLSDPHHDHPWHVTHAILAKPDAELTWVDFQTILGPFLPAGTYEESVYFLPLSLEYIVSNEAEALDLVTSIVWFVSECADRLAGDGLLEAARAQLSECFELWTGKFEVIHFDEAACKAKGWSLKYFDLVKNAEVVCDGMCALVEFVRHADLAENFFRSLADHGSDPVKAAWFLEMARSQTDVFHPPHHAPVSALLADPRLIRSAAAVVKSSMVASEAFPTYWRDTLAAIGVTES